MLDEYEINEKTLAIISKNDAFSEVIETKNTYIIKQNHIKIIDDSCKYFGSSYLGRIEGTKKMMGITSKFPIIIEESNEIIFFPTHSPKNSKCIWLNFNQLKKINKNEKYTTIIFNNNSSIHIEISYYSLTNQYLRASLLQSLIRKRKKYEK